MIVHNSDISVVYMINYVMFPLFHHKLYCNLDTYAHYQKEKEK